MIEVKKMLIINDTDQTHLKVVYEPKNEKDDRRRTSFFGCNTVEDAEYLMRMIRK